MTKKAIVTGITGQDGSYLAEFLLEKGYEVYGIIRRSSSFNTDRLEHLYTDPHELKGRLHLLYGDLTDGNALGNILKDVAPDEVYNLGAQSHVRLSFDQPIYTANIVALGTLRLLEAVRQLDPMPRFYQASSSEMFGSAKPPQSEQTRFQPRSPYACSKVFSHYQTVNYREAYGLFAVSGILFNHESPRRGETFVTRKITRAATRISLGLQDKLYLGNLEARRDWGFAGEYVGAMWLMLQQDKPQDLVIATGKSYSVQDFLEMVFGQLDLDWRTHVEIDPRYFRPAEVNCLEGDATKAREVLGWTAKVGIEELARMMIEHDLTLARREAAIRDAGLG
ncbi:GDP-mannose 4,6-dehydratase [Planctomycetota bacterium]